MRYNQFSFSVNNFGPPDKVFSFVMFSFNTNSPALKPNHQSPILYSCYTLKSRSGENFVSDHCICYVQAGLLEVELPEEKISFSAGEAFFVRRNLLAKFTKNPVEGGEFKSISILFTQETLKEIALEKKLNADKNEDTPPALVKLQTDGLLKNYFESLPAYEGASGAESLIRLKVEEGILLLLNRHSELKNKLFDFSEPGKIDLESFMNKNFRFNVEMKRFATLTGRSLATFKRDFAKTFAISPNRWLQKKRLEEARYLIKEKGRKPSEVYLEVGFEDLSHFSFAFKKAFGISPSFI